MLEPTFPSTADVPQLPIDTSSWPLLLKNYGNMHVRSGHFTPMVGAGASPLNRSLEALMDTGVINLDKSGNPSSHEVVSWVKRILNVQKTGHSGTLDPKVTGCLLVCLNRAVRMVKTQQKAGKEYVCVVQFGKGFDEASGVSAEDYRRRVTQSLKKLRGRLFQRPPEICAVKRVLRVREVYDSNLLDLDQEKGQALFWVSCEAGTYIRTMCVHLGLLTGFYGEMAELRRVRTGTFTENDEQLATLHDLLDAQDCLSKSNDESLLRKYVQPIESLFVGYPRIVLKDSAVNAVCYGAKLTIAGVLRFERSLEVGQEVVLMTTKGEAVAVAKSMLAASTLVSVDHGFVAQPTKVIMQRDLYNVRWGLGPRALQRKQLIATGCLDPNGKPNSQTPKEWFNYSSALPQLLAKCEEDTEVKTQEDADHEDSVKVEKSEKSTRPKHAEEKEVEEIPQPPVKRAKKHRDH